MNSTLEKIKKTRQFILNSVNELSDAQLNKIPAGFNNNIIWNLGHMVAAQQGLCYLRSGLKTVVTEDFFQSFKTESKPERELSNTEIENIKQLLSSTLDEFNKDYENGIFKNYTVFKTRYDVEIGHIDEAVNFVLFHEGLHCGYIMALKRLVK